MAPIQARSVHWRTAGACLALSMAAGTAPAGAVDWEILYRLTESLRVSDNIQLRPEKPDGPGFSSNTTGGLTIVARTPTSEWRTTGNISHLIFFGEGVPLQRERTSKSARSNFIKRTLRTDFTLNANFSTAPAIRSVFSTPVLVDPDPTDPGPIDPIPEEPVPTDPTITDPEFELLDFDRISYGASGGFLHRATRVDNLTMRVAANRVDFTGEALNVTPHMTVDLAGGWTRLMTRRVDGRARASVEYFKAEDETERQRLLYNATLGANFRASPRLTIDGNAGVAIIDQRTSDAATAAGPSDVSVGFVGDLSLSYTPRRDTLMTLAISQSVSPDGLGNLRNRQIARGAVRYQINELSSIGLTGTYSTSSATGDGGTARELWTVSPSYTHALTRWWSLALSYQWVKSDVAESNSAFLTLSHHGVLLP